jgi:hypothetical protein
MEYKITVDYIGGVLSDNSYKFLTKGTRPFVKRWMRELSEKVEALSIPILDIPVVISIFGRFTDDRRPDLANLHKVIGDAIKVGLGIDDKDFIFRDRGWSLGNSEQELDIFIEGEEKVKYYSKDNLTLANEWEKKKIEGEEKCQVEQQV